MIANNSAQNIESIEELTIYSLGRSQEGLDILLKEVMTCGQALGRNQSRENLEQMSSLVENLHDFNLFEHDVCSIFNINRSQFSDSKGNLESTANKFRTTLLSISEELEQSNFKGLSDLLCNDLSESLVRFKELMPLLRRELVQRKAQSSKGTEAQSKYSLKPVRL